MAKANAKTAKAAEIKKTRLEQLGKIMHRAMNNTMKINTLQDAIQNIEDADDFDVTDSNNILTETIAVVDGRSSGTGSRLSGGSGGACNWLGLNLIVLLIIRRFRCS